MNGAHDLGGKHGFGPVRIERDEPVFHSDWERAAFALHIACAGQGFYAGDEIRHWIEQMDPVHYLASRYYEHWLEGVESALIDKGMVDRATLDERVEAIERDGDTVREPVVGTTEATARLLQVVREGSSTHEETGVDPRFAPGARVRTKTMSPQGHTRLPQYARGRVGIVRVVYPSLVFPDTNALGDGRNPQHVYNVEFTAEELWGPDGEPGMTLRLDLWESYLDET
jgi:nitrile hydratase